MQLTNQDIRGAFGCSRFEEEILKHINNALKYDRFPTFGNYNNPNLSNCECRSDSCSWTEETIMKRLKERGIWDKIVAQIPRSFTSRSFLSTFGCYRFEMEIKERIESALKEGKLPEFSAYNDPAWGRCGCRSDSCIWDEEAIMSRLKKHGLWQQILLMHENA